MVGPALRNRDMTDMNDDTSTRPSRRSQTGGSTAPPLPRSSTVLNGGIRSQIDGIWNSFRGYGGDSTPPARPG